MPRSSSVPCTIKVKNGTQTVMLLLLESNTFSELKIHLLKAIRDTWVNQSAAASAENGISIPEPSFATIQHTAGIEKHGEEDDKIATVLPGLDEIHVASPLDTADLSKGWKEISNDNASSIIGSLGISDGSVLAYRIGDEENDFGVEFPSLDEDNDD
ncbi:hypothetical protein POJ06DRAFT_246689 [Lipomyces tetrasporus]|uniref:Uncharacterized protein n=1 Tax=Lipomyces tetrasporus TaxID=54092 RepID=A0AAD7QX65_9ASCO|nr:uncharacterized protein POJ06DRAFT_246689 [Lipomyces tetrasporus]KAJ8103137.1 hypothetical protein POJ06DRAFT_246689 [Lipomyces tetrasporus]